MNEDPRNPATDEADISTAYKDLATEQPAEVLDGAVLANARRAIRVERAAAWRAQWYRPVAFVATVGLSVALLLEMADIALVVAPGSRPATVNDAATSTPIGNTERISEAAIGEVIDSRTDSPEAASPVLRSPSETAAATGSTDIDSGSQLPGDPDARCSDEQRMQPSTWWHCIEDLEKRNLSMAAERELQELLQQYPGFSVPE